MTIKQIKELKESSKCFGCNPRNKIITELCDIILEQDVVISNLRNNKTVVFNKEGDVVALQG